MAQIFRASLVQVTSIKVGDVSLTNFYVPVVLVLRLQLAEGVALLALIERVVQRRRRLYCHYQTRFFTTGRPILSILIDFVCECLLAFGVAGAWVRR